MTTNQPNRYEQQFLTALKNIFIGAKVEGESGYICSPSPNELSDILV